MSPPEQIRVVVGEDQSFVREGIVSVLQDGGFDVVGTTDNAPELVRMADAYGPDVVIADIQMPPDHSDDGLRAALAIRAVGVRHPDELLRVVRGADHVESAVLQDAHDSFPDKGLVLADNDADLLGLAHGTKLCPPAQPTPAGCGRMDHVKD